MRRDGRMTVGASGAKVGISSEVVVCTRNRPHELKCALESFLQVTHPLRVLVVDASDDAHTAEVVAEWRSRSPHQIRYLTCAPGLTRQRMVAIEALASDTVIVHFVDDDVVVEPEYFAELEAVMLRDPAIQGAGGRITNQPHHPIKPLWVAAGLDSFRQGVVLASGVHTFVRDAKAVVRVQWLSGCAMTYRRDLFAQIGFDTRTSGYCLGEDVEFSFRASHLGILVHVPMARLEHHPSKRERMEVSEWWARDLVQRHRLVSELAGSGLSKSRFWFSACCEVVLCACEGLICCRRSLVRRALARGRGIGRILQQGRDPRNLEMGL